MSLVPGARIGHYEVVQLLGTGGMGQVYQAVDTRLGRHVALKLLQDRLAGDPGALGRFTREARAASALNHPNIVTIYDIGESEAGRYIAMEFVSGRSLRTLAASQMQGAELTALARQIAQALAVAHEAGIVHRDVKPENILLRDDGLVKILDFGIARLVGGPVMDGSPTVGHDTDTGIVIGSLRYMSPEQARGDPVTAASDMFSLGIVLFELATGIHPFDASSPMGVLSATLTRSVTAPSRLNPELPRALDDLILRMLEKDAQMRPTSSVCVETLEELIAGTAPVASGVRTARRLRHFVGRAKEHGELRSALESVTRGEGLLVCISGEPGIGKTTLVQEFLTDAGGLGDPPLIGRGHCSDRLAGTGAYLPVLEALDALLHGPDGDTAAQVMKLFAPTWYLQLAHLSTGDESAQRLRAEVQTGSPERLKREMGAFLRELSARAPIVLLIEDMHWGDLSTVDLLTYVAAMFGSIRVMVLVTARPSELLLNKHPFASIKLDLQGRGMCRDLQLEFLSRRDVQSYLAMEFPEHRFPPELATLIHEKTEGNPLFMSELARYLRDQGVVTRDRDAWALTKSIPDFSGDLPESIRGMIQRKIDELDDVDRRLLLAGSVQGHQFDSAVAGWATGMDAGDVEERLERLERVFALVTCIGEEELPDRVSNLRYRFVHILFQQALLNSLRATRRATLSAAVAQALERAHGRRPEIAFELALLFEVAKDNSKAAEYFLVAAQQATRLFASTEAAVLAQRALGALSALPEDDDRKRRELKTLLTLIPALVATTGYASQKVGEAGERAVALCETLGDPALLVPALISVWQVQISKGILPKADELAERLRSAADRTGDQFHMHRGPVALGITAACRGHLVDACAHLQRGAALVPPGIARARTLEFGQDAVSSSGMWHALALTFMLRLDDAERAERAALDWVRDLNHPFSLAYALQMAARRRQLLHDDDGALENAAATVAIGRERDFAQMLIVGRMYEAWAKAMVVPERADLDTFTASLERYRRSGAGLQVPHYLGMLAEIHLRRGERARSVDLLMEALELARDQDAGLYEPELLGLLGDSLQEDEPAAAEDAYLRARDLARTRDARLLELRAALRHALLLVRLDRRDEGRALLTPFADLTKSGAQLANVNDVKALTRLLV